MIVRVEGSQCLLISQPAHAWISGLIASNWGANSFLKPEPWEDMCFAASNHDAGWVEWELEPKLNPASGWPYDFKEMPTKEHFRIWEEAPIKTEITSRYSALLVSLHVMRLSRMHDFANESEPIREKAHAFSKGQDELQRRLTISLNNDNFYSRFLNGKQLKCQQRLMSLFDYLSLIVCMGNIGEETIQNVPHQSGEAELTIIRKNERKFVVDPWPFFKKDINLHCDAKRLSQTYSNPEALTSAIQQAKREVFEVKLTNF